MTSSSWGPTNPGETAVTTKMLRSFSIMYFSKNPNPSEWFTNSIYFFQSIWKSSCLLALHSSVHTACQESGHQEGCLGLAGHGLSRAWIPELLCWGESRVTPQVNRSLNCRCQGLISTSTSAVQASTPQSRRQLFKEIKVKVIVEQCKNMKLMMWTNSTWGVPNNSTQESEK